MANKGYLLDKNGNYNYCNRTYKKLGGFIYELWYFKISKYRY